MKYCLFLLAAIMTFSCSPKLSPDAGWGRQRWVVVQMKGVPVQQSGSRKDAFINFNVNERSFTGNGGCNQLNGKYSIDNNSISFSDVISTKMACSDLDFESTFLTELGRVDRYEMNGEELLLKRKRETVLVLRPRNALPE